MPRELSPLQRAAKALCWLALGCGVLLSTEGLAAQVNLAWDPSPSADISGYRLHYGQTSGSYTSRLDVGNRTSGTVTGLQEGNTYYFAVTAYNSTTESGFSNEVSKTIAATSVPPTADFSASPRSGSAPLTVNFTDTSSGSITSRSWTFGDGATSTSQNPSHTYADPGTYTVALTVTGPGGSDTRQQTDYLTVTAAPPTAAFSATPTSGTAPLTVDFTDTSSGSITAWSWDFGDGATSTSQNPSHTYADAGTYTVALTVTGPGGADTQQQTDSITVSAADSSSGGQVSLAWDPSPSADISGYRLHYGQASGSYTSQLDVGNSTSGTVTGLQEGSTYYFAVTAYNSTTESGFSNEVSKTIPATATLAAAFSATPTSGTAPLTVRFDTSASTGNISSWSWNFGDGSSGSGQTALKSYSSPGNYSVQLTVTGPEGSDTLTQTDLISVTAAPPTAGFSATPTSGTAPLTIDFTDTSSGSITSRSWTFGDGDTSTSQNPSHTYSAPGTYTVALTVGGSGGTDTEVKTDYISVSSAENPPKGRVTDGQVVLYTFEEGAEDTILDLSGVGTPLDLTVADPDAVHWLPGGGLAIDAPTAIKSAGAATKIRTALQASQALTLEAWVVPDNTQQDGPARIVALSRNGQDGGNFVLGQSQTQYLTRLRTSTTDQYGGPALTSPKEMVTTDLTHLVYTRDVTGAARFYVNGVEQARAMMDGDFTNWGDYIFALANEPAIDVYGNDRPWLGELHLVAVYDRAFNANEVNQNFAAGIAQESVPMETGEVEVDHQWKRVSFKLSFVDPVVVANTPSFNGGQPTTVRIRNVDATGFDIRLQEWEYLDGAHLTETVGYLVMERGSHTLPDGTRVEAGWIATNNVYTSFKTVNFQQPFLTTPVVQTTVASFNESDTVTTRLRNVGTSSFQVQMQEQEVNAQTHAMETITYIAWEPSVGTLDSIAFEVERTANAVTDVPSSIAFQKTFSKTPMFLADMQTQDGANTANIRYDLKDFSGIDVFVQEEQSADSEISHTTEVVGYMAFLPTP